MVEAFLFLECTPGKVDCDRRHLGLIIFQGCIVVGVTLLFCAVLFVCRCCVNGVELLGKGVSCPH